MLYLKDYFDKDKSQSWKISADTNINQHAKTYGSPSKFLVDVTFINVSTEEISDNEKWTLY